MRISRGGQAFFILPVCSGILLWLAWPPLPFTFLIFAGFVPLLMAEKIITEKYGKYTGLKAWTAFFTGLALWNILTTWWISMTYAGTHQAGSIIAGVFSNLANAALMTIPFMLFRFTKRYAGERLGYFSLVLYWMCFEYLHLRWEFTWPWLSLGNAFALNHTWVQWYEYTGQFGGTLWIWILNLLIFSLIPERFYSSFPRQKPEKKKIQYRAAIVAALILIPIGISLLIYYNTEDKGKPVRVTVLQPNIDPYNEKFTLPLAEQINKMLTLSKQGISDTTDYLVWPETSIPGEDLDLENLNHQREVRLVKKINDSLPHLTTILGINGKLQYDNAATVTARMRPYNHNMDTMWVDYFNTAIQIDTGSVIPYYNKSKLVPGVERMPYPGFFKFLGPLVMDLGGITGTYGVQDERTVFFNRNSIGVAPVICYESIFGEYVTRYIKNGASLIFIITNDGWWFDTDGHRQHLLYAKLRSIETRRSIARSANTGTSCFINQRGDISQATAYGVDAVISQTIYANTAMTFYVKHGDYLARIALWLAGFSFLYTLVLRIRLKKKMRTGTSLPDENEIPSGN